jgi:hypothetical protein
MLNEKENRLRYIDNAIWYWEQKLKGTIFWWDKNIYSNEWILSQIIFFKEMKLHKNNQ